MKPKISQRSRQLYKLIFAIGIGSLTQGCSRSSSEIANLPQTNSEGPSFDKPRLPDEQIREQAQAFDLADVKQLRLMGPNMACFANDPIIVTDRHLIEQFINALRDATIEAGGPPGTKYMRIGNGVDSLDVDLREAKREPITFSYNARFTNQWYGIEFRDALVELGKQEAKKAQNRLQKTKSQIRSVVYNRTIKTQVRPVEDPHLKWRYPSRESSKKLKWPIRYIPLPKKISEQAQVQKFLAKFSTINETLFDYTKTNAQYMDVTFTMKDGHKEYFTFIADLDFQKQFLEGTP